MRRKYGIKLPGLAIVSACCVGMAYGGAIDITTADFSHTEDFSGLGTSDIAWDDGNTIAGVYLDSLGDTGIPSLVPDSIGDNSTANAYNMGLAGDSDRALGWITSSGSGTGYVGIQFRNQTGQDGLKFEYNFVLEQWGKRNTAVQDFTLQYKVSSTGGNILDSTSWTTLGVGSTPVVDGTSPYELNGNDYQFSFSGTIDLTATGSVVINNGQHLTFRLIDLDHSGGDAMVGIDSISVQVIPESATLGLMVLGVAGALVARRLKI